MESIKKFSLIHFNSTNEPKYIKDFVMESSFLFVHLFRIDESKLWIFKVKEKVQITSSS